MDVIGLTWAVSRIDRDDVTGRCSLAFYEQLNPGWLNNAGRKQILTVLVQNSFRTRT